MKFGYGPDQNRWLKSVNISDTVTNTWYIRDAQGNTLAVYKQEEDKITWQEQYLYGSSRLGSFSPEVVWDPDNMIDPGDDPYYESGNNLSVGLKAYELTNHLGNVLATVSDDVTFQLLGPAYIPEVISASDYYPFGQSMTGRTYLASGGVQYRYGFNGKEADRDDEWGSLTHYD